MSRHRTDVVAFVFATCFLVCAGLAIGVRTANLGLGTSAPSGAWIAGVVLALAGVIGISGTLSSRRRDRQSVTVVAPSTGAGPDASPAEERSAARDDLTAVLHEVDSDAAGDQDEEEEDRG